MELKVGESVRFECNARSSNPQAQPRLTVTWAKEGRQSFGVGQSRDPRIQVQGGDPRRPTFLVVSFVMYKNFGSTFFTKKIRVEIYFCILHYS